MKLNTQEADILFAAVKGYVEDVLIPLSKRIKALESGQSELKKAVQKAIEETDQ